MVATHNEKVIGDHQNPGAPNAHYVQLPISHGKTATSSGCGRLYRVWGRFNTQDRALTA